MKNKKETLCLISPPKDPCIAFSIHGEWVMKIHKGKITFNTKDFPNLCEDEFAYKVLKILEECNVIQIDQSQWDNGRITIEE